MTDTHSGWVTFAGVMLFIVGVLNIIWGIAAIGDSSFFVAGPEVHPQQPQHVGLDHAHHRLMELFAAFSLWSGTRTAGSSRLSRRA